jgi:hypothetical protein
MPSYKRSTRLVMGKARGFFDLGDPARLTRKVLSRICGSRHGLEWQHHVQLRRFDENPAKPVPGVCPYAICLRY